MSMQALVKSQDERLKDIGQKLEARMHEIVQGLANRIPREVFENALLGAFRTTPALKTCTVESIFHSLLKCAHVGLAPNGFLGHAYLVPMKNSQRGVVECQLWLGVEGVKVLSRRAGAVSMDAYCVFEGDRFEQVLGATPKLIHEPRYETDKVLYAYSVAKVWVPEARKILTRFRVVPQKELDEVKRAVLKRTPSSPWRDHPVPMSEKTACHRLFKYLPKPDAYTEQVVREDQLREEGVELPALEAEFEELSLEPSPEDQAMEALGGVAPAAATGEGPKAPEQPELSPQQKAAETRKRNREEEERKKSAEAAPKEPEAPAEAAPSIDDQELSDEDKLFFLSEAERAGLTAADLDAWAKTYGVDAFEHLANKHKAALTLYIESQPAPGEEGGTE